MKTLVFIFGAIGYEVLDLDILERIRGASGDLEVRINSLGGDVFQGNAIANGIRSYRGGESTAYIEGVCASMATIIAARCDRVVMAEGSMFMIHDPRMTVFEADPDQMQARAELAAAIRSDMAAIYSARTGLEESRILEMMAAETWLTAREALELGFVDAVEGESSQGMAAMAASANRFHFNNAPDSLQELLHMRTKLAAFLQTLFARVVTDQNPMEALIERIVSAAGADRTIIQAIIDGSATVTPTDGQLQAFADALGSTFDELKAEAAKDFTAHKPRVQVQPGGDPQNPAGTLPTSSPTGAAGSAAAAQAAQQGAQMERERVNAIMHTFHGFPQHMTLRDQCIAQGTDEAEANRLLLQAIGRGTTPAGGGVVHVVQDQRDRSVAGITIALMGRADPEYRRAHRHELERNEFTGLTLVEIARHCLRVAGHGHRAHGDVMSVVGAAFTTSDFPNVLEDIARKNLHQGWEEAEETWRTWVQIVDMADFKQHSFTNLSEFDDLLEVPEGGEYKSGEFIDQAEKATLATYGRMFTISRQAIINDDVDAFTQIPRRMGRAANRRIGDLVYGVLTDNAAMSDGDALFHANHNNLRTTGAGAPDTAQFDFMRTAMGKQTGPKEKTLGIRPTYALVPLELEGAARVVVEAESEVNTSARNSRIPNSVRGIVEVVSEHRLSAASATQYYFAANPMVNPTVVAGFLNGDPTPRVEQQQGWRVDGTEFKVGVDGVAKAIDFRGLYRNNGA